MKQNPQRAVLFDMDGVLIDSVPLHWQAYNEVLAEQYGVHVPDADLPDLIGRSLVEQIPMINAKYGTTIDPATFIPEADRRKELLVAGLEAMPGVVALLESLTAAGYVAGVGTSTNRASAEQRLAHMGIRQHFRVVVGADDVSARKPDPEVYLTVARELGVEPVNCLVVEDAPTGIEAAHAAGMRALAVETPYVPRARLDRAELVVRSLSNVTVQTISDLIASNQ